MISFVVPAFNEEAFIGRTLQAIHDSARALGEPYEIVVSNDNSSDRTAEVAEQHGARVVTVHHRQIAGTRNSGARASHGEYIVFVDADTTVSPRLLKAAFDAMRNGAVGGGAATWFDRSEALPAYVRLGFAGLMVSAILTASCGGSFMFCTREAFDATGGFPENMYWGEESPFTQALKREGKFVVPWIPVIMSGRRFRKSAKRNSFIGVDRLLSSPKKLFNDRSVVQTAWYDGVRADDNTVPTGLRDRISHVIWLVFVILLYVSLFWNLAPWTWAPWPGALGVIRSIVTVFMAHVGLILIPLSLGILANVLRQKRPTDLLRSFLVIAFYLWLGWNALNTVIDTYGRLWGWLTGA